MLEMLNSDFDGANCLCDKPRKPALEFVRASGLRQKKLQIGFCRVEFVASVLNYDFVSARRWLSEACDVRHISI